MAQAQLDLILNAQKYQRQLTQTLGLTEKQAAREGLKMARADRKRAEEAAKAQQKAAKKAGAAWKDAFKVASVVAAVGIVKRLGGEFLSLTQSVIDYRNELNDAAARTGLMATTLQGLRLSAEATGQEFSSVLSAIERIPKLLADADRGLKTQKQAFEDLDVEIHEVDGSLRTADDVTRDLIKSLGNITDPTEKAAKGMTLFGRSGGKLVQALGAGNELFEQHVKLAEMYGVDVGPEASAAAARMQEEFSRLGLVARGAGDDLWQAFGGDDGALGAIRSLTTGIVFASDLLVQLRENLVGPGLEDVFVIPGLIKGAKNIEATADAFAHAKEAAQEYLIEADKTDRIASAGSKAMEAFNAEIERNSKSSKRAVDPQKELQQDLAKISGLQRDATEDLRTETEKLTLAYIEQSEPLLDLIEKYGIESDVAQKAMLALEAMDNRLTRAKREAREEEASEIEKLRQEQLEKARQAAEEEAALQRQVSDAKVSLAISTASAIGSIAKSAAADNEQAQRRAWAVDKAAAIAGAALNTALAVSNAFADVPYPANIFAAIEAGIQGAAHFAAVAASPPPSFYEGTYGSMAYASAGGTTVPVTMHPGEEFTVKNRTEVEQSRKPQPVMVQTWIRGRPIADSTAREVGKGGPLTAQLSRRFGRLGRSREYRS